MPHRAPYGFFEQENDMHTEPGWIWALGDGDKGAISDVAHFKVPETTFLGRETPKSVVLWFPPPHPATSSAFLPLWGAEYEKFSANGVNRRFGPRHGRRRVAMIAGPLPPRTAAAPFTAATSAAV